MMINSDNYHREATMTRMVSTNHDGIVEPLSKKMRMIGIGSDDDEGSTAFDFHPPRHIVVEPPPSSPPSASARASKKIERRPSVRFSPTSEVVVLPPRTREDVRGCWYDGSDYVSFKRTLGINALALRKTRTAGLMKRVAYLAAASVSANSGGDDDGDDSSASATPAPRQQQEDDALVASRLRGRIDSIRGMEHLLCPTVAKLLLHRRRLTLRRVLDEQRRTRKRALPASSLMTMVQRRTRGSEFQQFEQGGIELEPMQRIDDAADSIARASMENSAFGREWTRRITGLQQSP